jgi:hypothetical protein
VKANISIGSMMLIGSALAILLFAVGRVDLLVWIMGMLALLTNSFFIRRDLAAGENIRACFYAVFGTGGLIALFFNVSLWILGSKPLIPEHLQAALPDIRYILIAMIALAFAGGAVIIALRSYRKPR